VVDIHFGVLRSMKKSNNKRSTMTSRGIMEIAQKGVEKKIFLPKDQVPTENSEIYW
jgi:hypothetical protein